MGRIAGTDEEERERREMGARRLTGTFYHKFYSYTGRHVNQS